MEENKVQGSRRLGAFSIIKEVDKMTPILYQYCCTGETLPNVTVVLYKIKEGMGTEIPYFNYNLQDAQIVSIRDYMPSTKYKENENVGHLEEVKISANVFGWNNEPTDPKGEGDPSYLDTGFEGEGGGE
jgi:type VI secretion system secreted protein Hcp